MPSGNWVEVTPPGLPPARSYGGMAYDFASADIILFGGLNVSSVRLGDTWGFDGGTWTVKSPGAPPSARDGFAMASVGGLPFVFGGESGSGLLDELYKWVNPNWSLQSPATTAPAARKYAAIAEDSDGNVAMWGGKTSGSFDATFWTWDISSGDWSNVIPATSPPPRQKHSMQWDQSAGRIIMFGGEDPITLLPLNDVWEWVAADPSTGANADWQEVVITSVEPSPRIPNQGLAYDTELKRHILATGGMRAEGSITAIDGEYIIDGETFTIDDGINTPITFEFDNDFAVTGGNITILFGPRAQITTIASADHIDGETFTINDGVNPPTVFEFDDDASITSGRVSVSILGAVTATAMRDRIIIAINGASNLDVSAAIGGADVVALRAQTNSISLSESVHDAGSVFAVVVSNPTAYSAEAIRDEIHAAINHQEITVGSLFIKPHKVGTADVRLVHNLVDTRGNASNSDTVADAGFIVTDMTGVAPDAYNYNATGGVWTKQDTSVQPAPLDGAMLAFDAGSGREVVIQFGGTDDGTAGQKHYKWVWSTIGVSPYFSYPGVLQGRMQPSAVEATDGSWAMVMGSDQADLPDFFLDIGDEITIKQTLSVTGRKLIRFDLRCRYSPKLPKYLKVLDAGTADFYAPTKTPANATAVALVPTSYPHVDIELTVPTAVFQPTVEGDAGLQKFHVRYKPTDAIREVLGVPGVTDPAYVRTGDLMGQADSLDPGVTGMPSITASDYEILIGDSGLVRTTANGGDRLIGVSVPGASPFLRAHEHQLLVVTGAATASNNRTSVRIASVPTGQGDILEFDGTGLGTIPAGRVATIENGLGVKDLTDTGVTLEVLGAQWRAQMFIDIGGGDVLRAEVVENLVQADPDGFQRLALAANVSKISASSTVTFKLSLESIQG